jgi:hypothetical protein
MPLTYSNPRMRAEIQNWPMGGTKRGTAVFTIEAKPGKGERGVRVTNGAPKTLTYAKAARIVDGSDGRTYIAELSAYGFVSIVRSDMKLQEESITADDPRYAAVSALFGDA